MNGLKRSIILELEGKNQNMICINKV
jgi:hypothetical protein